jgi:hypothetical protein
MKTKLMWSTVGLAIAMLVLFAISPAGWFNPSASQEAETVTIPTAPEKVVEVANSGPIGHIATNDSLIVREPKASFTFKPSTGGQVSSRQEVMTEPWIVKSNWSQGIPESQYRKICEEAIQKQQEQQRTNRQDAGSK